MFANNLQPQFFCRFEIWLTLETIFSMLSVTLDPNKKICSINTIQFGNLAFR